MKPCHRKQRKEPLILGVGASLGQSNGVDLLYEGSENFGALTSFGVIPAMGGLSGLITGKVPGLHIDLSKVSIFHYNKLTSTFMCID